MHMNSLESAILHGEKIDSWLPWTWRVIAKEDGVSFGVDKNVLKLIIVMVAQLCDYPKNY